MPNSVPERLWVIVSQPNPAHLRAPQSHATSLQVPLLTDLPGLLQANRQRIASHHFELGGIPISQLRSTLREELLRLAFQYTRNYRDLTLAENSSGPLILAGHQPRLFHPGVWFKNRALSWMGESGWGTPINLVVDNDLAGIPAVPVPINEPNGNARFELCHFDGPMDNLPFELQEPADLSAFQSFDRRLAALIRPIESQPLVTPLWQHVQRLRSHGRSKFGELFGAARHSLEGDFGWQTLELPLSHLCGTLTFCHFLAELIEHSQAFAKRHNQALSLYRRANRVRSRSHPVPELANIDDWQEVPFWVYAADRPHRQRLFVRLSDRRMEMSDRKGWQAMFWRARLPEQLFELQQAGLCIRTRALTTTLFCRLLASDLFVHGIGGAKYDELTNEISRQFFDAELPRFVTLTATVRLPGHEKVIQRTDVQNLGRRLREIQFHPESFLDFNSGQSFAGAESAVKQLVARKQGHVAARATAPDPRSWQRELERFNSQLAQPLNPTREAIEREHLRLAGQLKSDSVLGSREVSFCCFGPDLASQLTHALFQPAETRNQSKATK